MEHPVHPHGWGAWRDLGATDERRDKLEPPGAVTATGSPRRIFVAAMVCSPSPARHSPRTITTAEPHQATSATVASRKRSYAHARFSRDGRSARRVGSFMSCRPWRS